MDYKTTKSYFTVVNEYVDDKLQWGTTIFWIFIGVLLMLLGLLNIARILLPISLVIFFCSAIPIWNQKNLIEKKKQEIQQAKAQIPSDEQYDAEVQSALVNMRQRALDRLGIDEDEVNEIVPITFDMYDYDGATEIKLGKDGIWRTDKYKSVYLFFSQHEVHCYTYSFNTLKDQHSDATEVYFYQDIVSFSTSSKQTKLKDNTIDYQQFKLVTSGGTSLEVSLRDMEHARRSIDAMRSLLRVKKQA